ncbi:MAG: PIN domain-containing protein [Thermoplasmata archaeon]
MRRVVLDTNALMMPFQFGLNLDLELERLLGPHEVVVPKPVLDELASLAARNIPARKALRLARKYEIVDCEGRPDDVLVELARDHGMIVVSNDKSVISLLKEEGISHIRLKSRTHLILEESL